MTDSTNTKMQMSISVLQDPYDKRMVIYKDDVSGFYCTTKAVNQVKKMNTNALKQKQVSDWTRLKATVELKKKVRTKFSIDKLDFVIQGGDNLDIQGTYVHPILYYKFMEWLSDEYTMCMMEYQYEITSIQGEVVIDHNGIELNIPQCVKCETNNAKKSLGGLCRRCFDYENPMQARFTNFRSKEQSFMVPLKEIYGDKLVLDKQIEGGKSKRRPDGFIKLENYVIDIEIDENQHKHYDETCENARIAQIYDDVGYKSVVFIRLNPDPYKINDQTVYGAFGMARKGIIVKRIEEFELRLEALKSMVAKYMDENNSPTKAITIERLFFDDYVGT